MPGTAVKDYAAYAPLLWAKNTATIGEVVKEQGLLWRRLVQPYLLAALNTQPAQASAALAGSVLREGLMAGGRACRPRIAHPTLAEAFVNPALAFLESRAAPCGLAPACARYR